MSTFGGKIEEIPQISVDRFDGENLKSEAYFLSHCHSDHMVGLDSPKFTKQLIENCKYVYASEISCIILRKRLPRIQNNLKELHLDCPTTICLKESFFSVTLIPAGHCPGSVMFLFESNKRVLYTGDYRINKHDIAKFKPFYNNLNEIKIIDRIYLDTTFFLTSYSSFPQRKESLKELCAIINEWTQRGKEFFVKLITSAKYGYEYVFNEIFKKLDSPVHVSREMHDFYCLIPEMDKSVTLDGARTQIHSGCGASYQEICHSEDDGFIKAIKISALRWTLDDLREGISNYNYNSGIHYVCYSTHASYEEGVELIRFLKPKDIVPCVIHNEPYFYEEMTNLIENHLAEVQPEKEEVIDEAPKLFPVKRTETSSKLIKITKSFDNSGILDSPPRDTSFIDSILKEVHGNRSPDYEANSNSIVDAIVSPVRNVRISKNMKATRNTVELDDSLGFEMNADIKSEEVEIEYNYPTLREIAQNSVPIQNPSEEVEDDGLMNNSIFLSSVKLSIETKDTGESDKSSMKPIEYKNTLEENASSIDNEVKHFGQVEEIGKCEDGYEEDEADDSILLSIIDSDLEISKTSKDKEYEQDMEYENDEDSIMWRIINSPPNNKKK